MKYKITYLLISITLILTYNIAAAAGNGVVACASTKSFDVVLKARGNQGFKNNFLGISGILGRARFEGAERSGGRLMCKYSIKDIEFTIASRKNNCLHYATGWNTRGTVCSASTPANCRAICP